MKTRKISKPWKELLESSVSGALAYGTPAYREWVDQWKSSSSDPDISDEQYEKTDSRLYRHFRDKYSRGSAGGFSFPDDFYFRGDYNGDRTIVLEICNPMLLTLAFLQELQELLKRRSYRKWRIAIPTYLTPDEVIIVYPSVIRISAKYEKNLNKSLKQIRSRMKDYTSRKT